MTLWEEEIESKDELQNYMQSVMGKLEKWSETPESDMMRNVRRIVLEDPTYDTDLCVFFDGEKSFECRVERTGLRKECFGKLYWKGGLCPYFKEFMTRLEE